MVDVLDAKLLAGQRVLVADDDPRLLDIYERMVGELGGDCQRAENGALAVAACRAEPFDLVLMDLDMPVMDGVAAIDQIRGSCRPQPTIIAMTALADRRLRHRSIAVGAAACLQKPLTPMRMRRSIARHLHGLPINEYESGKLVEGSEQAVFDPTRIRATLELMGGNEAARKTMSGLLEAFRRECPAMMLECQNAIDNGLRCESIAVIAHTLSSRSAALGMMRAHGQAAELETAARRDELRHSEAERLLIELELSQAEGLVAAEHFLSRETDDDQ